MSLCILLIFEKAGRNKYTYIEGFEKEGRLQGELTFRAHYNANEENFFRLFHFAYHSSCQVSNQAINRSTFSKKG